MAISKKDYFKLDKAYDDGFTQGYLQAESDFKVTADEMINEIREYAYDEPEGYICFCDRKPDKIVQLEDVEDIIHKHCDKEQINE